MHISNILLIFASLGMPFDIPLGIACLATTLINTGRKVRVLDMSIDVDRGNLVRGLIEADIVGIGYYTQYANYALQIARLAKSHGCTVIFGGVHTTAVPELIAAESSVDYVVKAEAENVIVELISQIDHGVSKPRVNGVMYMESDGLINMSIGEKPDIENAPIPAYEEFRYERYIHKTYGFDPSERVVSVMSSRGCLANCTFCASRIISGRKIRLRSVSGIVEEIQHLQNRYGISSFVFTDDTFTTSKKRVHKLCEAIGHLKKRISWGCGTRADCIDTDLAGVLRDAGCRRIAIGVESGSQQILDQVSKGTKIDEVQRALECIYEAKIEYPVGHFMIGNIGETDETIKETEEFLDLNPKLHPRLAVATPYPGTIFYERLLENGQLNLSSWDEYKYTYLRPIHRTVEMSSKRIADEYRRLSEKYT